VGRRIAGGEMVEGKHMNVNRKRYLVKLFLKWGERYVQGNVGDGELKYDIFDIW
jgi:hypothetical protein